MVVSAGATRMVSRDPRPFHCAFTCKSASHLDFLLQPFVRRWSLLTGRTDLNSVPGIPQTSKPRQACTLGIFLARVLFIVPALGVSFVLFPARACACGPPLGAHGVFDLLFPPVLQLIAVALVGVAIVSKLRSIDGGAFIPGFGLIGVALLLQLSHALRVLSVSDAWILHAGSVAVGGTGQGLLLIERAWSRNRSAETARPSVRDPQARREGSAQQINRNRRVVSPGVARIAVR